MILLCYNSKKEKIMTKMTIRQQVWLAAWTAAIQSGKYKPLEEAELCLNAFDEKFGKTTINKVNK